MNCTPPRALISGAIYIGTALCRMDAYAAKPLFVNHMRRCILVAKQGGIISLCASGNISPNNGYVQYRFGTVSRIELEFPGKTCSPINRFGISEISEGDLNFTHVKFRSGAYDYVLYQDFPSGIYVKRNGKLI
jgi:hypothetical protein